ncbi:hypothetical protein E1258_23415 [Micromonospora sp. KC207]|uniref:RICIN domain-containing protein n=1 Tax=Micromonospora sp. KC207 TaxID=2530377 RepID=UPI0010428862|nr:RICIN domain-containing protein [Micromonospora sp. KC207]TDC54797.1 hypothetical protein E1258_23415 [Micromonospora sp. KC207]
MPRLERLRHIALVMAVAFVLPLAVAPAPAAANDYEPFYLRSDMNGKCLEVVGGAGNGSRAQMWDCWGGYNQQWYWVGDRIISVSTGKCLEILDIYPHRGGYVGIWDCWGGSNQLWYWGNQLPAGGYELRNRLNRLCLEIQDSWPHNGAYVGMWDCFGGANESWYMDPVYW